MVCCNTGVITLHSIVTELFLTFHLLSVMVMCIIQIALYYYVYEMMCVILNNYFLPSSSFLSRYTTAINIGTL